MSYEAKVGRICRTEYCRKEGYPRKEVQIYSEGPPWIFSWLLIRECSKDNPWCQGKDFSKKLEVRLSGIEENMEQHMFLTTKVENLIIWGGGRQLEGWWVTVLSRMLPRGGRENNPRQNIVLIQPRED